MFVQHIQNSVGKSPKKKERSNQYKRDSVLLPDSEMRVPGAEGLKVFLMNIGIFL